MRIRSGLACVLSLLLRGCDLAPEYRPPTVEIPAKFKESRDWKVARPRDDAPRGEWWRSLDDRVLNTLEPRVDVANQDLAAALAVMDQARALTAKAQAGLLPSVNLNNSYSANKESAHRPTRKADTPFSTSGYAESILTNRPLNEPDHYGDNLLNLQATYEVDLWGRVRDAVAASQAQVQASAAELGAIRLSLQAELARDYIAMRGLDSEVALLTDTVESYSRALALTKTLVEGQIASPADSARAQAQLEVTRAQLFDVKERRALLEHAIVTLIGEPASTFSIASATFPAMSSSPPASVPSTLLERRPDIAAAERRVAAANELIGVARAAFFPRLTINLSGGTQDTGLQSAQYAQQYLVGGSSGYLADLRRRRADRRSARRRGGIHGDRRALSGIGVARDPGGRGLAGHTEMAGKRSQERERGFRKRQKGSQHIARALS